MKKPDVCVLRTAGTNCDKETAFAFAKVGAHAELVHVNRLIEGSSRLENYSILAIPGGFSYGDDIAAGKILANELKHALIEDIRIFVASGKLIIGICNGFQVLVKSGLLPGSNAGFQNGSQHGSQEASLIINDSGKFEDRWVYLANTHSKCIWTKDVPKAIYLPVAHGEGKFITRSKEVLEKLRNNGQIVFQYCNEQGKPAGYPFNPNGSESHIAGICDETGRIFGLMPHPERHIDPSQHPKWQGLKGKKEGDGLLIFQNGVAYAKTIM